VEADIHSIVIGRDAMACRFEIVFNAGEHPQDTESAIIALDAIDEIESKISIYRESSELSRINKNAASGWQSISKEVFDLLNLSLELSLRTQGAFDIASGSLTRTWGFLQRKGRTPSDNQLAKALAASGSRWIDLDHEKQRIRFKKQGVEINPGAIGKGWAIDRAYDQLSLLGIQSCLLHGGASSVRAFGTHGPHEQDEQLGWPVGIRHPLRASVRLATVKLHNQALATSGSGTQFYIERGQKLGHIIDPRNGRPAQGVLSATVVAPSAAEADALATAAYVQGPHHLDTLMPAGGDTGAILTIPDNSSGIRLILHNLSESIISIDELSGVRLE